MLAISVKDIIVNEKVIPEGSELIIDVYNRVAYWEDIHFDIFDDEYLVEQ